MITSPITIITIANILAAHFFPFSPSSTRRRWLPSLAGRCLRRQIDHRDCSREGFLDPLDGGCVRFLTFSQSGERPARYGRSRRFDTKPSSRICRRPAEVGADLALFKGRNKDAVRSASEARQVASRIESGESHIVAVAGQHIERVKLDLRYARGTERVEIGDAVDAESDGSPLITKRLCRSLGRISTIHGEASPSRSRCGKNQVHVIAVALTCKGNRQTRFRGSIGRAGTLVPVVGRKIERPTHNGVSREQA